MSHPGGIGHPMSDGYPGKGGRVGKEGRKQKTWSPWTGQLGKENAPLGEPYGARRKRDFLVIQGRRLVPREASKGNKGSTRLGSLGREVGASLEFPSIDCVHTVFRTRLCDHRLHSIPARSANRPYRKAFPRFDFPHGEFNGRAPIHQVFTAWAKHHPTDRRAQTLLLNFVFEIILHSTPPFVKCTAPFP